MRWPLARWRAVRPILSNIPVSAAICCSQPPQARCSWAARRWLIESLRVSHISGNKRGEACALWGLGRVDLLAGDTAFRAAFCRQLLSSAERLTAIAATAVHNRLPRNWREAQP